VNGSADSASLLRCHRAALSPWRNKLNTTNVTRKIRVVSQLLVLGKFANVNAGSWFRFEEEIDLITLSNTTTCQAVDLDSHV
jgi:hypothetical protein